MCDVAGPSPVQRASDLLKAHPELLPDPVTLLEPLRDADGAITDFIIDWVSPSVEALLGAPASRWMGTRLSDLVVGDDLPDVTEMVAETDLGQTSVRRMRVRDAAGISRWIESHAKAVRTADGRPDGRVVSWRVIDHEIAAERELERARGEQRQADSRFRRLMESSNVGMSLNTPDGAFEVVNQALCDFLGYGADALIGMTWQDITPESHLQFDLDQVAELGAGRLDTYRVAKQYIHAAGHLVWGDVSVSCLRDDDGEVEYFVAQIIDITEEVASREALVERERQISALAEQLNAELSAAAAYVATILPGPMTGVVEITSRYLPSGKLGGDCYNYWWADDDHLIVYVIDVSGHGVDAALLSVSVHNLLRSASLPTEALLSPEKVLADLNRTFRMERHDGRYFTMWYGVYQKSTRTLRYASAGHPPALLLPGAPDSAPVCLFTRSVPVGVLPDVAFTADTQVVGEGAQILLYSDGAYETPLRGGTWGSLDDFVALWAGVAARPGWSLDELLDELRRVGGSDHFNDDCCLVLMTFP